MANKKETEFWGFEEDERLEATSIEEFVEDFVGMGDPEDPIPTSLDLCGFVYKTIDANEWVDDILENILLNLDENYGSSEYCDYTEPTKKMREAAYKFVSSIISYYDVWTCEVSERVTVNVKDILGEDHDYFKDNHAG